MATIDVPGYQLASQFQLEIVTTDRDDIEKVLLCMDSFPLPSITTEDVPVYLGPGYPPMKFPGKPVYEPISLEITNILDNTNRRTFWCF